jgi:toxin-antitoxin system, antitoxin component, ribbon-helix-helix domain protein
MTTSNLNNRINKEINEEGISSSLNSEKFNKVTIAAIEEGRKIAKDPNVKGYHTVNELKKALDS